ncbi:MAG: hypothetical protein HQ518_14685 [Rhodopirellula sp.]|jgi:hypothetical protein|nr:hypothetical protein [Rhodopirellula sp.]
MTRSCFLLVALVLSVTGCGSTGNDDDAALRATVEAEQLQDQLQALTATQQ